MGIKDEVSADYMERMKVCHASKVLPARRHVLVTGAGRAGSIGEAIVTRIAGTNVVVKEFEGDVRVPEPDGYYFNYDTLIFCHGVTWLDWIENYPAEKITEVVTVNLTTTMAMTSRFVRETIEQPYRKQIIYIGSMAHRAVLNGSAAYCASKAGLAMFARCMAWELAPKGFDVFIVHPSNTEGAPMSEDTIQGLMRYRHMNRDEAEAYWGASLPRAQWLQPREIADLVSYLMSGGAGYLSGTQLDLGGGQR